MKVSILFICLLFALPMLLNSAVIGIDFGSEFFKVSLISPGKSFVIVENLTSKRKTNNAIAFADKGRIFESDVMTKRLKYPQTSFMFMNKFLGAVGQNHPSFEIAKKHYEEYLHQFTDQETANFTLTKFKLQDSDETIILTVEEVVAMILQYAQKITLKSNQIEVKDVVITVPVTWGIQQRLALYNAIKIAGLNPLSFITETTAVALYYGIDRLDEEKVHNVLYYDLGSSNLQVAIAQYTVTNSSDPKKQKKAIETVTILADAGLENVGGKDMDFALVNHFADEFDQQNNRGPSNSLRKNNRAMVRLFKESNKLKETLSANKNSPFFVEGIADNNDFKSQMTREKFEQLIAPILEKLTLPIDEVLRKANMKIEDIDAVEIVGGAVRVPAVQQQLKKYFGDREGIIGAHLNGDESMALGAAFQGANYSLSFRTRPVFINDGFNFEILLTITTDDEENISPDSEEYYNKNLTLFSYKKRFGSKRSISFSYAHNIKLQVFHKNLDSGETELYQTFRLLNISDIQKNETLKELGKPKINLHFELSSMEGTILADPEVHLNYTEEIEVEVKKDKKKTIEDKINLKKKQQDGTEGGEQQDGEEAGQKQEGQEDQQQQNEQQESNENNNDNKENNQEGEQQQKEKEESEQQQQQEDQEKKQEGEEENNKQDEQTEKDKKDEVRKEEKKKQFEKRNVTKTHVWPVKYTEKREGYQIWNETKIRSAQRILKKFDKVEENIKKTAEAKNKVESFIYQVQDMIEDQNFQQITTQTERDQLEEAAKEIREWLEEEGFNANQTEYKKRYDILTKILDPVTKRVDEHQNRATAINNTYNKLADYYHKVTKIRTKKEWITEEEQVEILKKINETAEWIGKKIEEQSKLAITEEPAFKIQDLNNKVEDIKTAYTKLNNKKKPKKKKVVDGETVDIDDDTDDSDEKQKAKKEQFEKMYEEFMKEQEEKKKKKEEEEEQKKEQQDENNQQQEQQSEENRDQENVQKVEDL